MSRSATQASKIGIIARPDILADVEPDIWGGHMYGVADSGVDVDVATSVGQLLDDHVEVVVVAGGDRLVGAVVSAHRQRFGAHGTPLRIFVVRTGRSSVVADQLDAPRHRAKTYRRLERAVERHRLTRHIVPTLEVSSSARRAAQVGFSFGGGLFYRLFEAYHRTSAGGVASTLGRMGRDLLIDGQSFEPVSARVAIDGRARADSVGYVLASTLERSLLGLHLVGDGQLSYQMGTSAGQLVRQLARTRAVPRMFRSANRAEPFDRLQIDWSGGYVLDGELFAPSGPYVVQLERGPAAHFVTF